MAYLFYMDKMLLPIAPSRLQLKVNNQNKTLTLINDGEINILKKPGLTQVDFDAVFPQVKYPFASYKNGFQRADTFLSELERLKISQEPFQFIVTRSMPQGTSFFNTNLKVSLEDYNIKEDSKNIFDVVVSIKLKQYKDYGTKTCNVTITSEKPKTTVEKTRETTQSPAPKVSAKTHKVVKGDSLWAIAQTYYGKGSRYPDIYSANQSTIDGKNKGTGNSKYTIYPGQVFTIPV